MRINHIGIVSKNINKEALLYQRLGYKIVNRVTDKIQMNKVIILNKDGLPNIELIEAISDKSTIKNFKNGYHHICFEGEEGEDIIEEFKNMKIGKIFTSPIVAPALGYRKVVFACLYNGCFVELIL